MFLVLGPILEVKEEKLLTEENFVELRHRTAYD